MSKTRILIVDDEPDILEMLEYNLLNQGYKVNLANNGEEALEQFKAKKPDLTASNEENVVNALKMGANDFLAKPVSPSELLIRVNREIQRQQIT